MKKQELVISDELAKEVAKVALGEKAETMQDYWVVIGKNVLQYLINGEIDKNDYVIASLMVTEELTDIKGEEIISIYNNSIEKTPEETKALRKALRILCGMTFSFSLNGTERKKFNDALFDVYAELSCIENLHKGIKDFVKLHSTNADYNEYMRGVHNGLALAEATLENREPKYIPETINIDLNKKQ